MANIEIPTKARQFFLHGVDSIAEWEAVLLLRQMPRTTHDAPTLAKRLYISDNETLALLHRLTARGIVQAFDTQPPTFKYGPQSADLDDVITTCAELYRDYLIPVTRIIHAKPKARMEAFADAFRLRKDKP